MKTRKTPAKRKQKKSRVNPDIYVLIDPLARKQLKFVAAKASIRLKRINAEQYCYLTWREGTKVRSFYLGRNRAKKKKL